MSIEFQYLTKKLASSQQVIKVSLKANRISTFILLLHCHISYDLIHSRFHIEGSLYIQHLVTSGGTLNFEETI